MIHALGFDLDGTLFDHRGAAARGASVFLSALGVTVTDAAIDAWFAAEAVYFEQWRSGRIGFAEQRRARLRELLPGLGVDLPHDDAALDALFERYLAAYRSAWKTFPGVRDLLDDLRRQGYRLGLLTNGSTAQQTQKLEALGLTDFFDVICISEQIGHHKPDPRAFAELVESLDVSGAECLFVGDDPVSDAAGARAAGLAALLIPSDADVVATLTRALAYPDPHRPAASRPIA
ncbi:HAD family hydrolase [Microbacterium oleivorans]|uniref:HAD family hydrolase n=1 Tax=Microbacterium oleivorans TaxID=273677 RepID=A0A4R5YLY0_9MICO|nr:HAD family hydrolase [Microbacterium oleivorans]TDL46059.1 HAD family hydrolase [Microbacterium oleivorans]